MKYMLLWSNENCADGYEIGDYDSDDEAKYALKDCYIDWEIQEQCDWKFSEDGVPMPTAKQIESWNNMYDECYCYLVPFDEETGDYSEYEEIWLTDEEYEEIGWIEYPEVESE